MRTLKALADETKRKIVIKLLEKEQINNIIRELEAITRQEYQTLFKDRDCRYDCSRGYGANLAEVDPVNRESTDQEERKKQEEEKMK